MRVMITGAAGQVGRALLCSAPADIQLLALTRSELDITNATAVHVATTRFQPEVVINAAAYTAVDKAESEPEEAARINSIAPRILAGAAYAISDCRFVHISTDYVFDGHSAQPYRPSDPTHPLSVYGRTKLAGEREVLMGLGDRAVVLRTAWVYAPQGRNFLLTMLRLMSERGSVRVVADQYGSPTAAVSIAHAIWRLSQIKHIHGVLHWTDDGVASWYDFAAAIAEEAFAVGLLDRPAQVMPISTGEYPTPARRPVRSVLDTRESVMKLGLTPVAWRQNLRQTLHQIRG